MCGIVGLHLKNPGLHPRLGELLAAMLDCMSSRGPDSAGLSLYSDAAAGRLRLSLRGDGLDWTALAQRLTADLGGRVDVQDFGDAATLSAPGETARVLTALQDAAPGAPARYIAHHVDTGADLSDALRMVLKELDGFFTLLVTTDTQFAVM